MRTSQIMIRIMRTIKEAEVLWGLGPLVDGLGLLVDGEFREDLLEQR